MLRKTLTILTSTTFALAMAGQMFLTASSSWAQSPAVAPADSPAVAAGEANSSRTAMTRRFGSRKGATQTQTPARQQLQEMDATVTSMHKLLKQMQAKAALTHSKDSAAKANLEMWELMLAHLDKQLDQLRIAAAAKEDLEARRASLYNQAYAKAAKEAQAATDGKTGQAPATPSTVPPSPNP